MYLRLAILAFALFFLQVRGASAQTCSFSNTGVDFGNVNLTGGGVQTATGTFGASCSGTPGQTVRVCANFNAGSGGVAASGDPRYLLQGATQLRYNLFRTNGVGQVWGSYTWSPAPRPPAISVTLGANGTGSVSTTIYGRLDNSQSTLPTGTFISLFSGTHTQIDYGYSASFNCSATLSSRVQNVPFIVRATNNSICTVVTTALDFGSQTDLTAARDAVNSIGVTCTAGTVYEVGLNGGLSGAADPTQRRMTNAATPLYVAYGVYRDAGRTQPWGNTSGSNTMSATGTGLAQSFAGYGRVPAQTTPNALTYTDTVVVTVTY
jgi:spore coat protein U-like protein